MLNKIIDLFIYGQSNTSSTLNLEVLHTNYLVIIKNECVHCPLIDFIAHFNGFVCFIYKYITIIMTKLAKMK